MKVLEIMPGRAAYFTRIFSKVIGKSGHLYELTFAPPPNAPPDMSAMNDTVNAIAKDPSYGNVTVITQPFDSFTLPEHVDVAWTSQNYHDFHNPQAHVDIAKFDESVFNALKPGGIFIVLDHSAAKGAGLAVTSTLHRMDEDIAKQELKAAGFKLVGESDALRNPDDPRTAPVFGMHDKTDQFILKLQRPAQ
jgi:predicted methyltransferase